MSERLQIGEVARAAGVSTRALRYYEQHGLLHPGRDGNGYRTYDRQAVVRAQNIRQLIAAGLTTDDIRTLGAACFDVPLDDAPACLPAVEVYDHRLAVIEQRLTELSAVRDRLRHRRRQLFGADVPQEATLVGAPGA